MLMCGVLLWVCWYVRACACMCACVSVSLCARACVHELVCALVFATTHFKVRRHNRMYGKFVYSSCLKVGIRRTYQ